MELILAAGLLGLVMTKKAWSHAGDHKVHSKMEISKEDKSGILLVHFGTSKKEARTKGLEVINNHVKEDFEGYEVREAYTSRMVIKKIYKQTNIRYQTPSEALQKMKEDGFTHIVVQASHVINGIEADHLNEELRSFKNLFKDLRIGAPLLSTAEDYMKIADIFYNRYKGKNIVLVGHGTPHHAGASYGMLQYILGRKGYKNIFIGTVEGYPGIDEVASDLLEKGIKNVTLVPLMVVAGVHAEDDIAVEWKESLEERGIETEVSMEGMGEIPEIQHHLINHIEDAIHHVKENMMLKKDNILKEIS